MLQVTSHNISNRKLRLAVSGFFFIAGCCFASWASRIPAVQEKLKMGNGALGSVLFALPVGLMVSLPVSGWLVSKIGSRKVAILAAVSYVLILPLLGIVINPWQLAIVLFFFGFCGNLLNISMNTQAIGAELLYGRSIMASFHGVWSLAGFTGAAIGTLLISFHIIPFHHFCIITVFLLFVMMVANRFLLMNDPPHPSSNKRFVKPDSFLFKLGLIAFCCMISEGTMFDWSGVYFTSQVHAPASLTSLGYVAFMSTMAGGRFVGDRLSEWMGKKKMIQVSGLIIATGLITAILFPKLIPATLGFLLVGFGVSSVVPLVYGAAGRSTRMNAGMALAAVSTIGYFGFLFGPPLIGFIAEASNLRISFSVIAILGFSTTLLAGTSKIQN